MADAKLSELTTATLPAAGTDLLYLVQGVNSRKITLDNLNASAANVNMKSRVQLGSASTITTAGQSVSVTSTVTHLNSTDGPGRIFIPSGVENQVKVITMTVYGGDYWISSNIANGANLLFNNVGESAVLIYSNSSWNILGRTSANSILNYNDTSAYANILLLGYATNSYVNSYVSSSILAKANVADLTTANISELTNLYYTNARVYDNVITLGYATNTYVNTRLLTKANVGDLTTSNVVEGSNLYYTNARVYANVILLDYATNTYVNTRLLTKANVADLTTDNITELSNLFYTNARVYSNVIELGYATNVYVNERLLTKANVADLNTDNVIEGTNLYFTNARTYSNVIELGYATNVYVNNRLLTKANVSDLTTDNVIEGANLYFTNTRARYAISAGTGVTYDNLTGIISIGQNVSPTRDVTFANVVVTGNLLVQGNAIEFASNTLVINDPLIQVGKNPVLDVVDLGFFGHYIGGAPSIERHAGLFRDASDGQFKLFTNLDPEPDTIVDTANASYQAANLVVNYVVGKVTDISNHSTSSLTEGSNLYFTNARVLSYLQDVGGNIIPAGDLQYNLGSPSRRWKDLYLSGNTVYLGDALIEATDSSVVLPPGSEITGQTTSNLIEGTNLYFTNNRVYSNVIALDYSTNTYVNTRLLSKANVADLTTSNIIEGSNLYFTNARVYDNVITLGYATNTYVNARLSSKANVADLTTSNIIEGSNLYFTNTRAISAMSGGSGVEIAANGLITSTGVSVGKTIAMTIVFGG